MLWPLCLFQSYKSPVPRDFVPLTAVFWISRMHLAFNRQQTDLSWKNALAAVQSCFPSSCYCPFTLLPCPLLPPSNVSKNLKSNFQPDTSLLQPKLTYFLRHISHKTSFLANLTLLQSAMTLFFGVFVPQITIRLCPSSHILFTRKLHSHTILFPSLLQSAHIWTL